MRKFEDWIDYMEGLVSEEKRAEMDLLLRHSVSDQLVYQNLNRLRREIKSTDGLKNIESVIADPAYLSDLHTKIMGAIKEKKNSRSSFSKSSVSKNSDNPLASELDFLRAPVHDRTQ